MISGGSRWLHWIALDWQTDTARETKGRLNLKRYDSADRAPINKSAQCCTGPGIYSAAYSCASVHR